MVCQSCHRHGPTKNIWFIQNVGVIVAWFHKTMRGELCRTCIDKYFWEYTAISFFFGWWGIISFFVTCVTIPVNIINYLGALSLPAIPAGTGVPSLGAAAPPPGAAPAPWPQPSAAPWPHAPPSAAAAPWPSPPPPIGYGPPAAPYAAPPPAAAGTFAPPWAPAAVMPVPRGSSTLLFVLGIIGLAWTGLWLLVAIGMMVTPDTSPNGPKEMDQVTAAITVLIFSLVVFGTPSGLFFWFGRKGRRRASALEKIASLAATHSPLPLAQIAAELGITADGARALVLDGVGRGHLAGRLDAAAGAFVSSTAAPGAQQVTQRCPSCGGESAVLRAPGVTAQCRYCGLALA